MVNKLYRSLLRMPVLVRAGILGIDGKESKLIAGDTIIIVRYDERSQVVYTEWEEDDGAIEITIIHVVRRRLRYGWRWYFACAVTERLCSEVVLGRLGWMSAKNYKRSRGVKAERHAKAQKAKDRLLGLNGRKRARGATRRKYLDQLEANVREPDVDIATRQLLSEARTDARSGARRTRMQDRNSTSAAMDRGLDRFGYVDANTAHEAMRNAWRLPLVDASEAVDPEQAFRFVEESAAMDLRHFGHIWNLKEETLGGAFLIWPAEMVEGVDHFLITVDVRKDRRPMIVATFEQDGETKRQVIDLVSTQSAARRYLRMKCPASGELCDILYFRDGRFASRKAQRLVHRSQRPMPGKAAA